MLPCGSTLELIEANKENIPLDASIVLPLENKHEEIDVVTVSEGHIPLTPCMSQSFSTSTLSPGIASSLSNSYISNSNCRFVDKHWRANAGREIKGASREWRRERVYGRWGDGNGSALSLRANVPFEYCENILGSTRLGGGDDLDGDSDDGETTSRKEKSLGLLCQRFLVAMNEETRLSSSNEVHLESVAKKMSEF